MRKIILFCLIVLCSWQLRAQEKKLFWDGYDWRKIDHVCQEYPEFIYWVKSAYLSGMFDSKLYYQLKVRDHNTVLADSVFRDLITPDDLRLLIAGLDAFYNDSAIRYLPLPNALIVTQMMQQDYPQSEIDMYLNECRQWINTLTLDLYK